MLNPDTHTNCEISVRLRPGYGYHNQLTNVRQDKSQIGREAHGAAACRDENHWVTRNVVIFRLLLSPCIPPVILIYLAEMNIRPAALSIVYAGSIAAVLRKRLEQAWLEG